MIEYVRNGFCISEQYFGDGRGRAESTCDVFRSVGVFLPENPRDWQESYTLLVDISQPADAILGSFDKDTRYEVRRAMSKDSLCCSIEDGSNPADLAGFYSYYDAFARAKGLKSVFRPRLASLAKHGMLRLSRVCNQTSDVLAWHAYVRNGSRAMLLYSASNRLSATGGSQRGLIGRANRLLHWFDMQQLKLLGCACYDFGGIHTGGSSPEEERIADFKKGFGGTIVPMYGRTEAVTFKGHLLKLYVSIRRVNF